MEMHSLLEGGAAMKRQKIKIKKEILALVLVEVCKFFLFPKKERGI